MMRHRFPAFGGNKIKHRAADHLFARDAHHPRARFVHIRDQPGIEKNNCLVRCVGKFAESLFGFLHRMLGVAEFGDVINHYKGPKRYAGWAHMRNQIDIDDAALPIRGGQRALVAHALHRECALDIGANRAKSIFTNDLANVLAEDGVSVKTVGLGIRLIRKLAPHPLDREVRYQRRNVVSQQAQMFCGSGRIAKSG